MTTRRLARATRTSLAIAVAVTAAAGMRAAAQPAAAPTPAKAAAPAAPADVVKQGRELFTNWSCNSCHSLADAGAEGHVGPSLDGDPNLTEALVVARVTNGQGPMPAFGGQMTDAEIATIAKYVKQVAIPAK